MKYDKYDNYTIVGTNQLLAAVRGVFKFKLRLKIGNSEPKIAEILLCIGITADPHRERELKHKIYQQMLTPS